MELADEFRTRARDCFRWAQNAPTLADQVRWLEMAQFWLKLAQHAEEQEAMGAADPAAKAEENGNGDETPDSSRS